MRSSNARRRAGIDATGTPHLRAGAVLKRCLVHLYSPPYLLSALAALASMHPGERLSARLLVQVPGAPEGTLTEIVDVVRELVGRHTSVEGVVGLTDERLSPATIRACLGEHFDEFYYAHDSTGSVCRLLGREYPSARRICIGDGFGMLYPNDFMAGYCDDAWLAAQRFLSAARERLGLRRRLPPVTADIAALVLPVDPFGYALGSTELVCCRKPDFMAAVSHCHQNAVALRTHMAELLERFRGRQRYLLLTENYAEAGHVRADDEIEMYAEIVQRYCEPESVVLVKPHPLEPLGKVAALRGALAGYEIVGVDARFNRYPIEIWTELVQACTVICSAYPVLSLKYAHGVDVRQPLDDALIDRWIKPGFRRWHHDSLRVYMEPLARLSAWDGRGMLWSGTVTA